MSEIPLCEKTRKYIEANEKVQLVQVRGFNCESRVAAVRARMEEKGEGLWDSSTQAIHNVQIQRAGHDRWGIDKVILMFCDDYMKCIYEFPFWNQWKDLIVPLLEQIDISSTQLIRCVFARMPISSNIPVHHDTGQWVNQSHRIHIPISTHSDIHFKVGRTEMEMERVHFEVGSIYELNNACKHTVENVSDIKTRVHLILDYVPEENPNIVRLSPGSIVHQTRRTLDESTKAGSRICPSFVIIGAQKAGTTALYEYITQHPLVVAARRKETHYFDWRWNSSLGTSNSLSGRKAHYDEYLKYFHAQKLHDHPSILSGEATPSYLLGGSIICTRMKQVCPAAKIIVILRNPIQRAFSHYQMTADLNGSVEQLRNRGHDFLNGQSFDTIVRKEMEALRGLTPYMKASEFDTFFLQNQANKTHGGHSYLLRGLYALQLELWIQTYGRENIIVLTLEEVMVNVQTEMNSVFQFLELPPHDIEDTSAKNTRTYENLCPILRDTLKTFYQPHNERLYSLLGRNFQWK